MFVRKKSFPGQHHSRDPKAHGNALLKLGAARSNEQAIEVPSITLLAGGCSFFVDGKFLMNIVNLNIVHHFRSCIYIYIACFSSVVSSNMSLLYHHIRSPIVLFLC